MMDSLILALRNLGPMRLAVVGGVLVAMVVFFIFVTTRLGATGNDLLYSDLDTRDSARIVTLLEGQNIPFDLKRGGTQIFIPADKVARRLGGLLAAADAGQLTFSEVSITPHVIDGLTPLNPLSLARLLIPAAEPGSLTRPSTEERP